MDDLDRYLLLRSMLEGDREARRVLADLLEEQGERGLAQWAREGSFAGKQRRVEFAMMLLPWRTAIGLGIDYIEAGIEGVRSPQLMRPWLQFGRDWLAGIPTREEVSHFLCKPFDQHFQNSQFTSNARFRTRGRFATETLTCLREAMAGLALQDPNADPGVKQRAEFEALVRMRRIAGLVALWPAPSKWLKIQAAPASMRDWQIERIKSVLNELVTK